MKQQFRSKPIQRNAGEGRFRATPWEKRNNHDTATKITPPWAATDRKVGKVVVSG